MKRQRLRHILLPVVLLTVTACRFDPAGLDRKVIPAQKIVFSAGMVSAAVATKTAADTASVDTVAVIELKDNLGKAIITRTAEPLTGTSDTASAPLTKGAMVTSLPGFNFFGYSYSGSVFGSGNQLFANDDIADYDIQTRTYISGDFYKNPASPACKTRYYAYTPSSLLAVSATAAGVTCTYAAPSQLDRTEDICIGASGDYTSTSVRPSLTLYHALSAVRFVIDNSAAPHLGIGSIGFRDLPKKATATLPGSLTDGTLGWTVTSSGDMYYDASETDIAGGYSTPWFFILPKGGSVQAVIDLTGTGLEHSDLTSTLTLPAENGMAYTYNVSFDSSYHNIYLTPDPTGTTLQFGESVDVTVTGAPPVADITLGDLTSGGAVATFATVSKTSPTTFRITNGKREPGDANIAGSLTTDKGGSASFSDITCKALVESISLSPLTASIANGETLEFTVSGVYPDGFSASVSGDGLEKISQTPTTVTVKNNSTSTSAGSGTLTVTTAIQSATATAAITIERKPATFSDINPKALTWAYNETAAKTLTVSGSHIIPSDISVSSPDHYTVTVASASEITVQPKGTNGTSAAYNETLDVTIGGVKKSVTLSQAGAKEVVSTETIYNDPTFNIADPALIPASGGTSAAPAVSGVAQTSFTRTHYKDGSHSDSTPTAVANLSYTITYSKDNASFSTTHTGYTGAHLGTTVKAQTVLGTMYVNVSANGKSVTKSAVVSQQANSASYGDPSVTLSYSPSSFGAAGGTASASVSASQTISYTSGSTATNTTIDSKSFSGSATGFSLNASNGTVSVSANTGSARSITVTVSVTLNGKTGSTTASVSQSGDSITDYSTPSVSFSYSPSSVGAAGGTAYASVSYSQTVYYASGRTTTVTSGGSVGYSGSATGFSLNTSNGTVSVAANQGSARSITVTVSVSLNGKTGTAAATVSQSGDSISSYSTPSVSFSYSPSSVGPAGGTAYPSVSYSQTAYYVSGKTATITSGASVSYSGSATGFSLNGSNGTVSVSANYGSARSISVTVYVTLNGQTGSASASVSQGGDYISSYSTPSVSFSYSPSSVGPAGGTAYPSVSYSQTVYYASGNTSTVSSGAGISYAGSATGFSLNGSNGTVSVSANYGSARSISVTVYVTLNGQTGSASASVSQGGDYISSYSTPSVSFSYSPSSFGVGGGTAYPSVSYSQTVYYASGNTSTVSSGASVSYSGSASGFTLSGGTVSAGTNYGSARSISVTVYVTLNGQTGSASASVSQSGNYVTSYSTPSVSFSYSPSSVGSGGGTAYPSVSYSQTVYYAAGNTSTISSGASVSYSGSATGFSLNTSNGTVSISANTGSARSITVTVSVTLNGQTGTEIAFVSQDAGVDNITSYDTPSVTLSYSPSSFKAHGGTAYPTLSYSQTVHYASGKTETITSGATVTYSMSGESRFTLLSASSGVIKVDMALIGSSPQGASVSVSVTLNGKTGTASSYLVQYTSQ